MNTRDELTRYYEEKERLEGVEERDALLSVAAVMKTKEGEKFFRYIFKSFEVLNLPPKEMKGEELIEYLGFLRAGESIYKLACQADFERTAVMMSKLERERYEHKLNEYRIEHGINTDPNTGSEAN